MSGFADVYQRLCEQYIPMSGIEGEPSNPL